jgi:hypothetical protein
MKAFERPVERSQPSPAIAPRRGHLAALPFLIALLFTISSTIRAEEPPSAQSTFGSIRDMPPESAEARARRLEKVAQRRQHIPILLHRGATRFAPENTLQACNAAMNAGADGVEIDIRRSRDGVLYLLHDDSLDRTTECSGKASLHTYDELAQCHVHGALDSQTCIPTLAALLVLARERAMLLHLDVKEPGLQKQILQLIEEADVWDHLVEVNAGNAETIRGHPKIKLLAYKGWFPQAGKEPDRPAIERFLNQPGTMIFCKDDPAWAVQALKRQAPDPQPLPESLFVQRK